MGFLSGIAGKITSEGVKGAIGGIGDASLKIRQAITGDISSEEKTRIILAELDSLEKSIETQASIIVAEAQGASWLQRNWRPGLMALFGVIIFNNYILNPWISVLFDVEVVMEIPEEMWGLLKLGIGGYIVGRSTEKAVTAWKDR